jgi:hypothetical protein
MTIDEDFPTSGYLSNWFHQHFCGCGDPVSVARLLLEWLEGGETKKFPKNLPYEHMAYWWAFAYYLDNLNLTEHGGCVSYYWLTKAGERVLWALKKYGTNPDVWEDYDGGCDERWDEWPGK